LPVHPPLRSLFFQRAIAALIAGIAAGACSDNRTTSLNPTEVAPEATVEVLDRAQARPTAPVATGLVRNTPQNVRFFADTTKCLAVSDEQLRVGSPVIIVRCGPNVKQRFRFTMDNEIRTHAGTCVGAFGSPPRTGSPIAIVPCDRSPRSRWVYDGAERLANRAGGCFTATGMRLVVPGGRAQIAPCTSPAPWSQRMNWHTPGAAAPPAPTPTPSPPPSGPPAVVAAVRVSPAANTIVRGDSVRLTATAYNASGQPISATITWSIANGANVASINAVGMVKALNVGTATVAARASGKMGTASLTVTAAPQKPPPPPPPPPTTPPPAGNVPSVPPTLPLSTVDVSWRAPTGKSIAVHAGDNLQNALNAAQRGDEIVIDANATFTGSFVLPAKPGTAANGWITVRTTALAQLPPLGQRLGTQHAGLMPKLIANGAVEVLRTAPGASGWRIVGIEMTVIPNLTWVHNGLVLLGDGSAAQRQLNQVATDLILDRVYIHGQPQVSLKRCVALNAARAAVVNSRLQECHGRGFDSQAIAGWNGPGPYLIENNRLEAAGEVIMFGGSDPTIPNLIPTDITIRRNYLYRPTSWKGFWTVKNLFELKNAQRVLVEGNVMENNWVDGQIGFAVVLGTVNQNGGCSWCIVQDVVMRYNHINNSAGGFSVFERCGKSSPSGSYGCGSAGQPTRRIALHHNLVTAIGAPGLGTNGFMYQLLEGVDDLWIEHNTGFAPVTYMTFNSFQKYKNRFTYRNNIGGGALYMLHSSEGLGTKALARHLSSPYVFAGNVLIGSSLSMPSGNSYPLSQALVGFLNPIPFLGNWSLGANSPFKNAGTGGATPGINWSAFANLTANVRS
jgi:hypothetical protein